MAGARLVPGGGRFSALCPNGHKVAEILHHWTVAVLCRCRHVVHLTGRESGRIGFVRCPNGHPVAEVLRDGTLEIRCRCKSVVLIRRPSGQL